MDALIGGLEKLIAKKRDLKQAAMQQLLSGKTRLPGFKGEREVKRLGEVADIDSDNLGSDTPSNYTFNYISLEDVDVGSLRGYSEQVFSACAFAGTATAQSRRHSGFHRPPKPAIAPAVYLDTTKLGLFNRILPCSVQESGRRSRLHLLPLVRPSRDQTN